MNQRKLDEICYLYSGTAFLGNAGKAMKPKHVVPLCSQTQFPVIISGYTLMQIMLIIRIIGAIIVA